MAEKRTFRVNGEPFQVEVLSRTRSEVRFRLNDREYLVEFESRVPGSGVSGTKAPSRIASEIARTSASARAGSRPGDVRASLPGVTVDICTSPGTRVQSGDLLLRIEAMKMQNSVFSPVTGKVQEIFVSVGSEVTDGQLLLRIQPENV